MKLTRHSGNEPDDDDATPKFVGGVNPLPATTPRERTWLEVYTRMYAQLHHIATVRIGQAAAEDVVHETLFELMKKWDSIPPDRRTDAFVTRAVLFRIRDHELKELRYVDLTPELEESTEVPIVETEGVTADLADAVDRIVSRMPPRCREAVELRFWQDMDGRELAEAVGLQYETVRRHMKRAFRILRESLGRNPEAMKQLEQQGYPMLTSGGSRND